MTPTPHPQIRSFPDTACTVCGCVCDDLTLTFEGDRLTRAENACSLAIPWFEALAATPTVPTATVNRRGVSLDEALTCAAEMLRGSCAPLIYGLSSSSTPGQRAAVELAEAIGATVDTTASVCHGPSIMAIQSAGESTCSLGEVRQRADLVVFWGANPCESHPRHFERYSLTPASDFLPRGRSDRKVVVVDAKRTATADLADEFFQVLPDRDFEMIWGLRQLIRDPTSVPSVHCGVPLAGLRSLAEAMRSCRYGVVFFGLGLAQRRLGHATVDGLLRLVAELNAETRFTARRMRIPGDVSGADSVLCWQTGFPFAVNLARGYPRYNPGEFTATELLERGEADCCIVVGSECIDGFGKRAKAALQRIPTILLDPPHIAPRFDASVRIATAIYGIHAEGTAYRMDEVPIPLRKLCDSPLPSDDDVLLQLLKRVRSTASGSGADAV